jgi:hypothetical protein
MDQIKYQGYARERGFNPIQLSTASVEAIGQQGNAMLRQMRENQDAERGNRNAFLSAQQNAQQLERQNRADNFEFQQRSTERFQQGALQNQQVKIQDAINAQRNFDKDLTIMSSLAGFSQTLGKAIIEYKKGKDEQDELDGYASVALNGPDPQADAQLQVGLSQLKAADERIQTTADMLQDSGAPVESTRNVRKLSKAGQVGRAKALADLASLEYSGYLKQSYATDDQTQIQYVNPTTGMVEIITPKSRVGPDQTAAVNSVLFKKFIKEKGLLGINPTLISKALMSMRQQELGILGQEREDFTKAENEKARADLNMQFDAALSNDPVSAFNDAVRGYSHLSDERGTRLGFPGAINAAIQYLVATGNEAALRQIADSPSYMPGKTWGEIRKPEFRKALRDIQSQSAADEDLKDRLSGQERENWSDSVMAEFSNSPNGVDEAAVDKAIATSESLYDGWVDPRLLKYRENRTLQARTIQEQNTAIERQSDQITEEELRSGKYQPEVVNKWLSRARENDNQFRQNLKPYREQYTKQITSALDRLIPRDGYGNKNEVPSYWGALYHAQKQLDIKARAYMASGKGISADEAYSRAAQDLVATIDKDNPSDASKRTYGTYEFQNGEFARWGSRGSGGQGGLSKAVANVNYIRQRVINGGQAAIFDTNKPLISKAEAESLVNPNSPIPLSIGVIANALPRGKEMSEFEIIDALLQAHGLPPRQKPFVQQRVETVMSPRLRELLSRTPTALRTSRGLVDAGMVGPGAERQAIGHIAQKLGVDPVDVATFINYETSGSLLSGSYRRGLDIWGGDGNNYFGWIQFSPANRQKYGVKPGMNAMQMADAVANYLKDSGIRPGDGLEMMYQAVQAPAKVAEARALGRNVGRDSNASISEHVRRMRAEHRNKAGEWLMQGAAGGTTSAWRDSRLMSAPARRLLTQLPLTSSFMAQESFRKKPHEGNDYGVASGTKLSFKQPGVVLQTGDPNQDNGGYGGFMDIRLSDGNVVRIAHLSKVNVQPGQRIGAKQVAALSGNTGRSTGAHVHIEHLSGPTGTQETTRGKRNPSWIASQVYADI